MTINGVNISAYNAKQLNFEFDHSSIKNDSEWAAGYAVPYFAKNATGFMAFTLTLVVKGDGREAIRRNCSDILSLLLEPAELALDGFETTFRAILKNHDEVERSLRKYHLLKLTFDGYEHGELEEFSGTSSVTVENPGNIVSPAIITITPRIGAASIELTGICRDSKTGEDLPVTISGVRSGKEVVLDGVNGLVTEDGAAREVEMWTLPSVVPGETTVTCDNANMTLNIKVLPLYM